MDKSKVLDRYIELLATETYKLQLALTEIEDLKEYIQELESNDEEDTTKEVKNGNN